MTIDAAAATAAAASPSSSTTRSIVRRNVVLRFADSPDLLQEHADGHARPAAVAVAATTTDAALVHPQVLFDDLSATSAASSSSSSSSSLRNTVPYERAFIAIDLPRRLTTRKARDQLPSLVVPIASAAAVAETTGGANKSDINSSTSNHTPKANGHAATPIAEEPMIILPTLYRRFFGRGDRRLLDLSSLEVSVRSHIPLTLTHIVLAAQSTSAFAYAQDAQDVMEQQMNGRLLRQNDMISFGTETFAVVMSEPVLQGIVLRDTTEVFVTFDERAAATEEAARVQSNSTAPVDGYHEGGDNDKDTVDDFDASNIIVDEHFFSKGVLDSLESNVDGATGSMFADTSGTIFSPCAIADEDVVKDALQAYASRAWRDPAGFDVENCVLLDESLFPRLGAFEGDWALVEVEGQGKARAVKMLCSPRGWTVAMEHDEALPVAHLSPLLLQNLHPLGQFDPSRRPFKPVTLRSLGSWQMTNTERNRSDALPDCPLPLPFADSLTISRVAGPLSVNRKYQGLFLGALRTYFEASRRVVQQGDIFAVSFDKNKVQWAVEEAGGEENGESTTAASNAAAAAWNTDDAYDLSLPTPLSSSMSEDTATAINNAVVYFCVTDVTPEVSEPSRGADAQAEIQADLWIHEMARTGQFGCAVDTSLTKMVQAGVMQSRVIDTQSWLHIASDTPTLPLIASPLTANDSMFGRLLCLMQATLMPDAAEYGLHLSVLLKGARGCGKRTLVRWVAQQTGVHVVELNCYDVVADTDARTEGVLRARFEQAVACAPAIVLLRHIEALARKSQALETGQEPTMAAVLQDCLASVRQQSVAGEESKQPMPVAVIGTTGDAERCPTGVLACFRHELAFEAPNEQERRAILETCAANLTLSVDVSMKSIATQTAALVASDLVDLVSRAQMAAVERINKQQQQQRGQRGDAVDASIVEAGVALTGSDFDVALTKARLSYSENIGAPKIPNVTWDDVGGLVSVKDDILDTIQLPLEHPELFSDGLKKRSGILLYGPPGTGKTLLAKAVATSCSLNFFSVKGPELLNMYIGESEANVRRVFQRARDAKPCVIFFDELDSIAPKRGNQGDSGGVMDRIVSQLLAELDGMSSGSAAADVFVIGATNRPDLLDSALLRPGRFDRMLYLAVSQTHTEQLNILQALTRKFKLDEDVGDLSVIAEQCPMNLTGADFYALCSDAMLKSMTRKADWIDGQVARLNEEAQAAKAAGGSAFVAPHPLPLTPQYYLDELTEPAMLDVKVARADFEAALAELVPSVSAQEMQHYRSVQQRFSSTDAETDVDAAAADARASDGAMRAPVEAQRLPDLRTVAEVMAAMQNGAEINGHGGEVFEDEQRRNAKGKGKARALDTDEAL